MTAISIVTVVLNSVRTVADCMKSVQMQEYVPEHIITDGGSTDGTLDVIMEHKTYRTYLSTEPDNGIYDAMNKGIKRARGDIIGILNADDLYPDPHVLTNVIRAFRINDFDSCYSDLVYVDSLDTSKVTRYWHSGPYNYRRFYWGWMPPHPTFFVRRSAYEKYGLFNLHLGSAADYELMLRFLVKHRITTAYIPKIMVKMRIGGRSTASIGNRLAANRNDRLAWRMNGLRPYPWTLYLKPLRKLGQWIRRP